MYFPLSDFSLSAGCFRSVFKSQAQPGWSRAALRDVPFQLPIRICRGLSAARTLANFSPVSANSALDEAVPPLSSNAFRFGLGESLGVVAVASLLVGGEPFSDEEATAVTFGFETGGGAWSQPTNIEPNQQTHAKRENDRIIRQAPQKTAG